AVLSLPQAHHQNPPLLRHLGERRADTDRRRADRLPAGPFGARPAKQRQKPADVHSPDRPKSHASKADRSPAQSATSHLQRSATIQSRHMPELNRTAVALCRASTSFFDGTLFGLKHSCKQCALPLPHSPSKTGVNSLVGGEGWGEGVSDSRQVV